MKKGIKVLALAVCAIALVVASVFGTLAYLTSKDTVINTFTVGNVKITLDETPVDNDGKAIDGERVKANAYKLVPGATYDKDPTIHVDANSEKCWLFVKVENGIASIEAAPDEAYKTIAEQMENFGWTPVDNADGIFAYNASVSGGSDVVVFNGFKIAGTTTNDKLAELGDHGATITVTAYAIQAAGFDTAAEAWNTASAELDQ